MAENDIYRVKCYYELPTSGATWSIYFKETTASSGGAIGTELLLDAFANAMQVFTQAVLAQDCNLSMFECERVFGVKEAKSVQTLGSQAGASPTDSLPNNAAIVIKLLQSTFPGSSNGRIRLPGIAEGVTNTGVLSNVFLTGGMTDFITALVSVLDELSAGTGRWTPGVISAKVLNAAPPAKDWLGAFAPLIAISVNTIIGIMRKRGTRARGRSV